MKDFIYESEYASFNFEKGILIAVLKKVNIDIEVSQKTVKKRLEISNGMTYPVLIDTKLVKSVTREARQFLGSEKGCEGVKAAAFLVNSKIGAIIINFFLRINKPLVPTKLFNNKRAAVSWLKTFVNQGKKTG